MAAYAIAALNLIKNELTLHLPYMSASFDALPFVPDLRTRGMGTDTTCIRFNPRFVLDLFLDRTDILKRTYMQSVIHCVFCHMYRMGRFEDEELFFLCTDIATENIVDGIDNEVVYRLSSDYRDRVYERLEEAIGLLTPDKLYDYFSKRERDYIEEDKLRKEFSLDNHSFWKMPENKSKQNAPSEEQSNWQKRAKRMKNDLVQAKEASKETGTLERMLRATYKSKTDYKRLLERYAIVREEMKIDPDSFDLGLYAYGFLLYDNMPLIEENEYSQRKAVEELVIAIDTSASCQARHVQRFLNEISALLDKSECFFKHTDIVIIECDNQIQKTTFLDDPAKIRDFSDGFSVKGGYGTDFRPVFTHVEHLRQTGRLRHMKGLMYFTDGYGTYPKTPTAYETSFILWKDGAEEEDRIPSWARTLYFM